MTMTTPFGPRMLPLDDGMTYVDPLEVLAVEHRTSFYSLSRRDRKAGLTVEDVTSHYVRVQLRNGNYVEGRLLGRGISGVLSVSDVMEALIEAVGP